MSNSFSITVNNERLLFVIVLLYTINYIILDPDLIILHILSLSYIVMGFTFLICCLVIRWKKVSTLELNRDNMILYGKELEPQRIRQIKIQGYFMTTIMVVHSKSFHITRLPFRFQRDTDASIKQLISWAKLHHIPIKASSYFDQK